MSSIPRRAPWNGPDQVYTLSLDGQTSGQALLDRPNYAIGRVARGGRLIAAYWTGSEEHVVCIDPATGLSTPTVGVLGDLQMWTTNIVYDPAAPAVHTIGFDRNNVWKLYGLNLTH